MADIGTEVAGVKLRNPTVLASGIMGVTASSLAYVAGFGAGAVTTKSIGLEKRPGHTTPVIAEIECGLLNAVGLSGPAFEEAYEELLDAVSRSKAPVFASIYAKTAGEYAEIAEKISPAKPALIEANISCPNVEGKPIGSDPDLAARVAGAIKDNTKIPLSVKLTPNVADITLVAKAVAEAGCDCLTAINTYGPGMRIDPFSGRPILSNRWGGMSGKAIKPLAVRCVYQIYDEVDVPIIGTGGVYDGLDAVEFLMAGASACGIGTAVMEKGLDVFSQVSGEIKEFMEENGYSKIKDLVGLAHKK